MQSVSSRIWTRVAVSISYDDNHYTTGTSLVEGDDIRFITGIGGTLERHIAVQNALLIHSLLLKEYVTSHDNLNLKEH